LLLILSNSLRVTVVCPFRAVFENAFTFVINGIDVVTNAAEAAAFSPVVALQLSVDACTRKFIIYDDRFDSTTVSSFGRTLSGRSFGLYLADAYQLGVLCELLSNPELERSWVSSGLLDAMLLEDNLELEGEEELLSTLAAPSSYPMGVFEPGCGHGGFLSPEDIWARIIRGCNGHCGFCDTRCCFGASDFPSRCGVGVKRKRNSE
jgi:hypothetical protein